jgi:hypothetical protein
MWERWLGFVFIDFVPTIVAIDALNTDSLIKVSLN